MTKTAAEDRHVVFDTIRLAAVVEDHRIRFSEEWSEETIHLAIQLAINLRKDADKVTMKYEATM